MLLLDLDNPMRMEINDNKAVTARRKPPAAHWMFEVAVAVKAFDGILEIICGSFLSFRPGWVGPAAVAWAGTLLAQHPANWLAHSLAQWGDMLTIDTEHFATRYLIAHGAAKLFITWGLFRERMWAFPTALVVFGLLIFYQLYRYMQTHSITLAVLIIVDLGVCYLIWYEYRSRVSLARTMAIQL